MHYCNLLVLHVNLLRSISRSMYKVRIVELSKPKRLYAVSVRNQYLCVACSGNYEFKVWRLVKTLLFR
jgi:hypothetical protein